MAKELLIPFVEKNIALTPERLKGYAVDPRGYKLFNRWAFYRLKKYVNDFLINRSENRWVIMPGLRGTGKTTLLSQIYFYLSEIKGVPKRNIFYISLDEPVKILQSNLYEIIGAYEKLFGENLESLKNKVFLLIDEAHYDKNWGITLKTIFDKTQNVFVIATGSSALSLQTDTDIARRATIEKIFPLNFSEYIMLKYNFTPIKNLKEDLEQIFFFSKNSEEAFNNLKKFEKVINNYWSQIKPLELEKYLEVGTLPYAISFRKEEEVFERILSTLGKVIEEDIPLLQIFGKDTLNKAWNLLLFFSVAEKISYDTICNRLQISKATLIELLKILIKADLIFPIRAYGSVGKIVRKTPKYKFTAPALKSSLLWKVGKRLPTTDFYGNLLEDTVAFYLYRLKQTKKIIEISYDSEKEGANFIIINNFDDSKIPIEIGYGDKGIKQIQNTMNKIKSKYGILISDRELEQKEKIICVPKRFFLLI